MPLPANSGDGGARSTEAKALTRVNWSKLELALEYMGSLDANGIAFTAATIARTVGIPKPTFRKYATSVRVVRVSAGRPQRPPMKLLDSISFVQYSIV
jgi:hypothetical protein